MYNTQHPQGLFRVAWRAVRAPATEGHGHDLVVTEGSTPGVSPQQHMPTIRVITDNRGTVIHSMCVMHGRCFQALILVVDPC